MKLHQLRYFQCLAHYLHYRKASEALYISQPTLSFAIKELEKLFNYRADKIRGKRKALKYITLLLNYLWIKLMTSELKIY